MLVNHVFKLSHMFLFLNFVLQPFRPGGYYYVARLHSRLISPNDKKVAVVMIMCEYAQVFDVE